ncbi:MAG: hypothetical protein QOG80_1666 [Pseudonocardiales bacterium]|jgi:GAF domain-containing protein|nr:hypothetical protein [Pseudonocardiales bacterium]
MNPDQTAQQVVQDLAELARAAGELAVPAAATSLCASIVEIARRVFGAAACSLAVLDDEAGELEYLVASGAGADAITGTRMSVGRGLGGWVAQSGQAVLVSDLGTDHRFARDIAESTSYIPTSLMALPVEGGELLLGVLTVLDRDAQRPDAAHDLELASVFAAQAAAALQVRSAFADVGRVVLQALHHAAQDRTDLAAALLRARPTHGPAIDEFTALLLEVYRASPGEQQLAVRILRDVLDFSRSRNSRPGSEPG